MSNLPLCIEDALAFGKGEHTVHAHLKRMAPSSAQCDSMTTESAILCHVMLLNSVIERTANRFAEACGLTFPQWMALGFVGHCGAEGIRHTELGHRLMLSKAPVTGVVDRLERHGYVLRVPDKEDRRVSRVIMTPEGEKVWFEVRSRLRENSQALCQNLSEEKQKDLLSMLSDLLSVAAEADPILNLNSEGKDS